MKKSIGLQIVGYRYGEAPEGGKKLELPEQ